MTALLSGVQLTFRADPGADPPCPGAHPLARSRPWGPRRPPCPGPFGLTEPSLQTVQRDTQQVFSRVRTAPALVDLNPRNARGG